MPEDIAEDDGNGKYRFETSEKGTEINAAQPIRITPDTIVRSDRIILKPADQPQELRPFEVEGVADDAEFEEIYVDDLDEYIK